MAVTLPSLQSLVLTVSKKIPIVFSPPFPQLKMKITDFENRRSFKSIWLNSQFREEVRRTHNHTLYMVT